jgi:phospholipid-translocating ATPase
MGVLDQDVDDKVSLAVPQLYTRGIERKEWTQPKFWLYMADGLYQSVLVFWAAYLLYSPANFLTSNGLGIEDVRRMGVYVAAVAVVVVNTYVLFNTYRWDWLTLLVQAISMLLFFFWTGVWTSSTGAGIFYKAGAQVFGQLTFWAMLFVTIVICLLPRFTAMSAQKVFFPRDIDIIREQVKQGHFDYLKDIDEVVTPPLREKPVPLDSASDRSQQLGKPNRQRSDTLAESTRPMIPPSTAQTTTTHGRMNGSDATEYSGQTSPRPQNPNRLSTEINRLSMNNPSPRPSMERPRQSYERSRQSMDRLRPSFEQSDHMTSAAMLTRMESSGSALRYTHTRERGNTIGEET